MHPQWRRICAEFMLATSHSPGELQEAQKRRSYDRANRPETYLVFPDAVCRVELGPPVFPECPDLWSVLGARRSKRNFLPEPLTLQELNLLLWGSQGVTADMGDYQLRTAPSAGALYPVETYLVVNRVEGMEPGLYHLDVKGWALEGLELGDLSGAATKALLGQEMARTAAVNFLWTAVLERTRAKYHERAYRYVWWDAGHISENLNLVATALGLGVCCVGAWHDDLVHELTGIDGVEHVSAMAACVGRVAGHDWREDRRPPAR